MRGKRIYMEGKGRKKITAFLPGAGIRAPGAGFPCVNCHLAGGAGQSEGGSPVGGHHLVHPHEGVRRDRALPGGRTRPTPTNRSGRRSRGGWIRPGTSLASAHPRYGMDAGGPGRSPRLHEGDGLRTRARRDGQRRAGGDPLPCDGTACGGRPGGAGAALGIRRGGERPGGLLQPPPGAGRDPLRSLRGRGGPRGGPGAGRIGRGALLPGQHRDTDGRRGRGVPLAGAGARVRSAPRGPGGRVRRRPVHLPRPAPASGTRRG